VRPLTDMDFPANNARVPVARPGPNDRNAARRHWSLDDIPWQTIQRDVVGRNEALFYMVASASLMESATDLYTANLIEYFAGDDEVTSWLERHWLPEELQHGRALRRYVETAWPDFPWEAVREHFVEEFRPFCDEALEPARGLEMASRCVVETGTASFYTTLSRASPDPVLAQLTRRIAEDEIRHYKHFYRYFRKYREIERPARGEVAPALWRRLRMTGGEDRLIVLKHVHRARHPRVPFDTAVYRRVQRQCRAILRPHFPVEMSVRMVLKPLALGRRTQRVAVPVVTALARRVVP
jgi:rubrerythrin